MKKAMFRTFFYTLLFVCLILSFALPSSAESHTNKRYAFEFAELYAYRFSTITQKLGKDFDMSFMSIPFVSDFGETYFVSLSFGSLNISKKDFTVESASFILHDFNADSKRNDEIYFQAASALSALEYNGNEDELMDIFFRDANSGYKNAIDAGLKIIYDEISPIVRNNYDAIISGDEIEVYSGNYRYYVSYYNSEYNGRKSEYFHLTAKAK